MDSPIFAQDIDNIEFSPRIPQPTSYIKVRSKNKRDREFDRLFLAQELEWENETSKSALPKSSRKGEKQDQDSVWALSFSRDGKYLAAGGENGLVKIWSVLSDEEDRQEQEVDEAEKIAKSIQLRAAVFQNSPLRTYTDHEAAILDLQWSKVSGQGLLELRANLLRMTSS
jgi:WD repeat-containing protein 44